MSNTVIFAIGVALFAVTTWATLVVGYLRFQQMNEPDSPEETVDPVHRASATDAPGDREGDRPLRLVGGR